MTANNWESFWSQYRNIEASSEEDLFFQVGKTINKKPISPVIYRKMVEDIRTKLELSSKDTLLEICCGNGLITEPLSYLVEQVYAFDFAEHLIETAKRYKSKENIIYKVGDATKDFFNIFEIKDKPSKYLMNDCLAYFNPKQLNSILKKISNKSPNFLLYITNVPNDELKWNFYNTEERKNKYLENLMKNDFFNEGLGNWWSTAELNDIARNNELNIYFENQSPDISNYRMNILVKKNIN